MHPNPKQDAQKVEDAGLTAEPAARPPVAKPDARDEEGIETAREVERSDVENAEGAETEEGEDESEVPTQRED